LSDGRVLFAGGRDAAYSEGIYVESVTRTAELYDPATDVWSPLPPMPEARAGGAAVVLKDGSVLLVGGYDERAGTDGTEVVFLASAVRFIPSQ
jgi:N-acetylneuraminic acid mutarotase